MSNKNVLLTLHDGLSKETAQKIYPADLAHLLGYGATQIKTYVKMARAGQIQKPNARLERAAHFAVRLGELEGYSSLFPLIPKLSGNLDDEEWMSRTGMRIGKMINAHESSEVQLDLIDDKGTETDHQIKKFFGFASPLSLDMIEQDTKSGHIPVSYDVVVDQLIKMFGASGDYEFSQVKAAMVAIECPEMVEPKPVEDEPDLLGSVTASCHAALPDEIYSEGERAILAEKVVTACEQLNVIGTFGLANALHGFIGDVAQQEKKLLCNIRLVRNALRDSSKMSAVIEMAETVHQMSDIIWPEYVDERTRNELKDFDKKKIREALSYGGEVVVKRVLDGFVKEAQLAGLNKFLERKLKNM